MASAATSSVVPGRKGVKRRCRTLVPASAEDPSVRVRKLHARTGCILRDGLFNGLPSDLKSTACRIHDRAGGKEKKNENENGDVRQ